MLLSFPDSFEATSKLNNHLLTPSDLAQRYGHLEVACLLRFVKAGEIEIPRKIFNMFFSFQDLALTSEFFRCVWLGYFLYIFTIKR